MPRFSFLAILSILACNGAGPGAGFPNGPGPDLGTASTSEGMSGAASTDAVSSSTGAPSTTGTGSTSSMSSESTANASTSTDVPPFDLGSSVPAGCAGKIDFLFVLSNSPSMEPDEQARYLEALPVFIETIGDQFADFDSHIMVVSTSAWNKCDDCCCCPEVPASLCGEPFQQCDAFIGSGVTFPVGIGASNKRCHFAGGNRYITSEEPDPVSAFLCPAQGGFSGGVPLAGEALTEAIDGKANAGGCNNGFLRDDALLVVTIVSDLEDNNSAGTPDTWRTALLDAKYGDVDAIVLLVVTNLNSNVDRLQALAKSLPHSALESGDAPSWGPFFSASVGLVADVCAVYVPQ